MPTAAPHQRFPVGPPPGVPAVSDGSSVWWALWEPAEIRRFDLQAGRIVARLVPGAFPTGLVLDEDGRIWASAVHGDAGGGYVARIDPKTNAVERCLRVGRQGEFLSITGDTMWIASWTDGRIVALDLATDRLVADLAAPEAHGIVAADDGVWSPRHHSGTVVRIDPRTLEMTEIETGLETTEYVALTSDAVWVGGGTRGDLVALSRADGSVLARLPGVHYETVLAHGETVWALDLAEDPPNGHYGRVVEIDARTRRIIRTYPLPGLLPVQMGVDPDGKRLFLLTDTRYLVTLEVGGGRG